MKPANRQNLRIGIAFPDASPPGRFGTASNLQTYATSWNQSILRPPVRIIRDAAIGAWPDGSDWPAHVVFSQHDLTAGKWSKFFQMSQVWQYQQVASPSGMPMAAGRSCCIA